MKRLALALSLALSGPAAGAIMGVDLIDRGDYVEALGDLWLKPRLTRPTIGERLLANEAIFPGHRFVTNAELLALFDLMDLSGNTGDAAYAEAISLLWGLTASQVVRGWTINSEQPDRMLVGELDLIVDGNDAILDSSIFDGGSYAAWLEGTAARIYRETAGHWLVATPEPGALPLLFLAAGVLWLSRVRMIRNE